MNVAGIVYFVKPDRVQDPFLLVEVDIRQIGVEGALKLGACAHMVFLEHCNVTLTNFSALWSHKLASKKTIWNDLIVIHFTNIQIGHFFKGHFAHPMASVELLGLFGTQDVHCICLKRVCCFYGLASQHMGFQRAVGNLLLASEVFQVERLPLDVCLVVSGGVDCAHS